MRNLLSLVVISDCDKPTTVAYVNPGVVVLLGANLDSGPVRHDSSPHESETVDSLPPFCEDTSPFEQQRGQDNLIREYRT